VSLSARVPRRRGDGRCRHTSLGRPLEGGQALQSPPIREADDLIISFEDEPFLGDAERTDAGSDLTKGRDVDVPTEGCVLDAGAPDRQARGGILC
jgi:hypothetical protein